VSYYHLLLLEPQVKFSIAGNDPLFSSSTAVRSN
jgi:hypothetical protein